MATTSPWNKTLAKQGWYKRNEIAITPWLFLVPGLFVFAIYVVFPIFQSFRISLFKWDGLGSLATHGEYIGMANYEKLLTRDRSFNISLWNNLKWLIFYLASIPAGLFIALFLNQTVRGIRLYKSLFFFPFVISQIVVGLVFTWFYDPQYGLFNGIIGFVGFEPINVLGDPTLSTYGVIAAGLWPQTAYCMILYLTGLNSVDPEQIEAARLDGAKGMRMLWHVILPQLRPATFIAFVVTVIGSLRSFDLISIMTNGGPFGSSRVLSFYMFEKSLSEYGFKMGYGAAIAVILFLIMMMFIGYFLWRMYQDEKALTDEIQSCRFGAITDVSETYQKIIARLAAWLSGPITHRDVALAGPLTGRSAVLDKTRLRFSSWQLLGLAVVL
tara:strand:+ start:811 stop:1962 length:1152 start_codon:yes stop_codon:yes gene_type:complete